MLKIKEIKNESGPKVIKMGDMKPLQVAKIIESSSARLGNLVMRTATANHFEVIDLSDPGEEACWIQPSRIRVELLPPGEVVEISIFNK